MTDLIYPELSYKIVGISFKVFNEFGFGLPEKQYQAAFAKALTLENIPFKREEYVSLSYEGEFIGKYYLDFVVDDKIVVELKVKFRFGYVHIKQVMAYLKSTGKKLAIIIYYTHDGVKYKRVVNNS